MLDIESLLRTCTEKWANSPQIPVTEPALDVSQSGPVDTYNPHRPSSGTTPTFNPSPSTSVRHPISVTMPPPPLTTTASMSSSLISSVRMDQPSLVADTSLSQHDLSSPQNPLQLFPDASSQFENSVLASLESLKTRGKGAYTCPKGLDCDKGGVNDNGEMIVFKQNSAFRSVKLDAFCIIALSRTDFW